MRDLIRSFAATAIIQVANIASGVMLARMLLPEGRGELATAMLWPSVLAAVGLLGLAEATAYSAARRIRPPDRIFASALVLAGLLSALLLPVGWFIVDRILVGVGPEARGAAFLYLAFIPLNHIGLVVVAMHQGSLSVARWNVLRVSVHIAFCVLIPIVYALDGASVVGFAVASLAANAIVIVLGVALGIRQGWLGIRATRADMGILLRFGLKVHLANTIAMLNERADVLVISLLLSPGDLGLYVAAATIARGAGAIGDTFAVLVFPKIAQAQDGATQRAIAGRYVRAVFLVSVTAAAVGVAVVPWLVVTVFGAAFAPAAAVAQVLLPSIVPFNVKAVLSAVLKGANRGLDASAGQAVGLVLSLLLLAWLLPGIGLMGAAVAALLAQAGAALLLSVLANRRLGLRFRDQFRPRLSDIPFAAAKRRPFRHGNGRPSVPRQEGV